MMYSSTNDDEEELPHFMETLLVCKVHCSTPWISRWVTFRDTPTWRTPCCWAVHKQRTPLTPSSEGCRWCLPYVYAYLRKEILLFPFSKMGTNFPPLHQNMLLLWAFVKHVSQCTLMRMEKGMENFTFIKVYLKWQGVSKGFTCKF